MAVFQSPPTWAEPIIQDERTGKSRFNPIWLKWFLDMVGIINESGGGSGVVQHNDTGGLQGGTANEFYHLTQAQHADLTDTGDSALHFHSSDRARANHTGTQTMSTISDLPTLAHGTWTPTLTNVTNISASTPYQGQYLRVGNTVVFSGLVDVDPTAAAASELGISLPIASNFGALEDLAGVGACHAVAGFSVALEADITNNRAAMKWIAVDLANRSVYFSGAYQVI
jgi:hypothetical protein